MALKVVMDFSKVVGLVRPGLGYNLVLAKSHIFFLLELLQVGCDYSCDMETGDKKLVFTHCQVGQTSH